MYLLWLPVACGDADVAILLDSSGSINFRDEHNWDRIVNFTQQLVDDPRFSAGTRFAIVSYSDSAELVFGLNEYRTKDEIRAAIRNKLRYKKGETNIAAALRLANERIFSRGGGDRATAPKIAILVSDGAATLETDKTLDEARSLRSRGAFIASVGVTGQINENELRQISSNRQVFKVDDFDQLSGQLGNILSTACEPVPVTTTTMTTPTTKPRG